MDPAAEGPTACDNQVSTIHPAWTRHDHACDKQNVVNNPASIHQISTSAQLTQMKPFSAPQVHHSLPPIMYLSPAAHQVSLICQEGSRMGAGPEHASDHTLEQGPLNDRSTGAGCVLGSAAAAVVPGILSAAALTEFTEQCFVG